MTAFTPPDHSSTPPATVPVDQLPADAECGKCFRSDVPLLPDPEIDEVWFCAECWEERIRTTATHEMGYDNDIGEE